jgi:hypothetical protein
MEREYSKPSVLPLFFPGRLENENFSGAFGIFENRKNICFQAGRNSIRVVFF